MTKEQEFRKQTEESKFEAFTLMCKKVAEIEKENTELKTKKIPQLERKIASIRGAHSVDCKKLNARTEQVERLKKENAEMKENNKSYEKIIDSSSTTLMKEKLKNYKQLTKAKEIIKTFLGFAKAFGYSPSMDKFITEAEQFLKEVSE